MLMDLHRGNSIGNKLAQQRSIPADLPQEGRKEKHPSDSTCDTN